jgi:hypothetical protein
MSAVEITRRLRNEDQKYLGIRIPLSLDEIPTEFCKPAKGKFPTIEAKLNERGITIPTSMDVQTMYALLAIGESLQVLGMFNANGTTPPLENKPKVELQIDPSANDNLMIGFFVMLNGQSFSGDLYGPDAESTYGLIAGSHGVITMTSRAYNPIQIDYKNNPQKLDELVNFIGLSVSGKTN